MRIKRFSLVGVLTVVFVASGIAPISSAAPRSARFADVVSRTRIPFEPLAIADGFGSIWVATDLGVSRIDPATGEIVAQVGVGGVASVATGPAGVFISSYADDRVARIDPSTNQIVWSTPVPGPLRIAAGRGCAVGLEPGGGHPEQDRAFERPRRCHDHHRPARPGSRGRRRRT